CFRPSSFHGPGPCQPPGPPLPPQRPAPRMIPPIRKNVPNRNSGNRKNPGKKPWPSPSTTWTTCTDSPLAWALWIWAVASAAPLRSPALYAAAPIPTPSSTTRISGTKNIPRRMFDLLRLASDSTMAPSCEGLVNGRGRSCVLGGALFRERGEVLELLAVGPVDHQLRDRPQPRLQPVGHVVHSRDRLRVGDARARAVGLDVIAMLEVRVPGLAALPVEVRVG